MNLDLWLAFVAAYTVISLIKAPSVFMVTDQALSHGLSASLLCILGDVLGGVLLMTLAFLGAGTILATSALLFQILKWVGVFYIAYLGYRQIAEAYHGSAPEMAGTDQVVRPANMRAGFFVGILNPKAIAFYMAFKPSSWIQASSYSLDPATALAPNENLVSVTEGARKFTDGLLTK